MRFTAMTQVFRRPKVPGRAAGFRQQSGGRGFVEQPRTSRKLKRPLLGSRGDLTESWSCASANEASGGVLKQWILGSF
jgi:hypothetical protein